MLTNLDRCQFMIDVDDYPDGIETRIGEVGCYAVQTLGGLMALLRVVEQRIVH